jgi:hypothetical protein
VISVPLAPARLANAFNPVVGFMLSSNQTRGGALVG